MAIERHWHSPGAVASAFMASDARVVGIMGPFGSGKSVAVLFKLWIIATRQPKGRDGKRRSRIAVIRNTYPDLRTTTIKTFFDWIPLELGDYQAEGPPTYWYRDKDHEVEFVFVALDRLEDVRKLLGMELTAAWINEAREIPKAILDALTGRVGRYPAVIDGGCNGPQILMDTNPPDSDHWWYTLAEGDTSSEAKRQMIESMLIAQDELRAAGVLAAHQKLFEFFRQPGGRDPLAENLANLPAGYYTILAGGKSREFIDIYVNGNYGYIEEGKRCYPEYVDSTHCKTFELLPHWGLRIGMDFGMTPAAVIAARTPMGAWRVRHEIVATRMGATALGQELSRFLWERFPDRNKWPVVQITGDPAGVGGGNDDQSVFEILRANGILASPAATNDFTVRRDAVGMCLSRMIDGEPGMLIHPECATLRKACAGKYKFDRIQVSGDRYRDKPNKNEWSHVAEALQYLVLGGGEGDALVAPKHQLDRAAVASDVDWSPFD